MGNDTKPLNWLKTDTERLEHAVKAEKGQAGAEREQEGIDYGVVILPPVIDTHNPEVESYSADYVKYAQDRLREYYKENGEIPRWERDAEEATATIMRQAEEATVAMSKDIPDLEGAELKV